MRKKNWSTMFVILLLMGTPINCSADATLAQTSRLEMVDGTPYLSVNGVSTPLIGLFIYNPGNVESFVAPRSPEWVPYMQEQVDRARSAGLTYLGFNIGTDTLYTGPAYPTDAQLADDANWDWERLDQVFDYAAKQGVFILPSINSSKPPRWWAHDNNDSLQTDNEDVVWSTVSFNNTAYWEWADKLLAAIVNHYKTHPALLGWDIRVGTTGENNYAPNYTANIFSPSTAWCDYSIHARTRFRQWLTEQYPTDTDLQNAWSDRSVTLATAEIPQPLAQLEIDDPFTLIEHLNGGGDSRRSFYDWLRFRLDEKTADMVHFGALFRKLDPDHILVSDPAFAPLRSGSPRTGQQDGERIYRSPYIDAIVHHPRVGHDDRPGKFNTSRLELYLADIYALHHHKLSTWANEETSELTADGDQDNLWRLASIAAMHASLGRGDGWITGDEADPMIPAWSDAELAEIRRLNTIYSAPGLRASSPEVAVLTDPLSERFYYHLGGRMTRQQALDTDRRNFVESLFTHGLTFDTLTVDDVLTDPDRLLEYKAILIINLPRLPVAVAQELARYSSDGGGLFIAGRTGLFDLYGNSDPTALETLLGATVTGQYQNRADEWLFDTGSHLVGDLKNVIYGNDNLYSIPQFDLAGAGYTPLAHLKTDPDVTTVGVKDKTIFWFPRLTSRKPERMHQFQRNLWAFFGVVPRVVAEQPIEVYGDNYTALFSPTAQTVRLRLGSAAIESGALVWDWISMRLMGEVAPGTDPEIALEVDAQTAYFLGVVPLTPVPAPVAVSGASIASARQDGERFVVDLHRASVDQLVTLIVYPGEGAIAPKTVIGGVVENASEDVTGRVQIITIRPSADKITFIME